MVGEEVSVSILVRISLHMVKGHIFRHEDIVNTIDGCATLIELRSKAPRILHGHTQIGGQHVVLALEILCLRAIGILVDAHVEVARQKEVGEAILLPEISHTRFDKTYLVVANGSRNGAEMRVAEAEVDA